MFNIVSSTHSLPACLSAYDIKLHRLEVSTIILHDNVEVANSNPQCEASGVRVGNIQSVGKVEESSESFA